MWRVERERARSSLAGRAVNPLSLSLSRCCFSLPRLSARLAGRAAPYSWRNDRRTKNAGL